MTIELTGKEIDEQFQEAAEEQLQWDPSDDLDITYKFDARISQGWRRKIWLRKGIVLFLDQHKLNDQWIESNFDEEINYLWLCFKLSGQGENISTSRSLNFSGSNKAGNYCVHSNGLLSDRKTIHSDVEQHSYFNIEIRPELLRSFMSASDGELPGELQHLIKSPNEAAYERDGDIQPPMSVIIQQILQCPYQGMVKRVYLESKALELVALVLDHEIAIQQGEVRKGGLKPEQLERVHYAREILLHDLSNSPTLEELSRQVGLNDFLLKQGFRQAFGNTVFGELQAYRLEMAKEVLAERDLSVSEAAHLAGYASARSFARAFRRRFGVGPKEYQKTCR